MSIKLTCGETRDIFWGGLDGYELVLEGDWDVDYKYQHMTVIVKHLDTGKYYEYSISRSGSPFSEYWYSYEDEGTELFEVEQVTKTIVQTTWERV